MKKKLNLLNFWLLAFFTFLVIGCSKSTDPQPDPPGPDNDKISIPILASYQEGINIVSNQLTIIVNGEADLSYYIPPGKDTTIVISGLQAKSRKGKSALLTMSCTAKNNQGAIIPVCYNHADGKFTISSLAVNNPKIEWLGQMCGTTGDQVILRIKLTMQYAYPDEYTVLICGIVFGINDYDELNWSLSASADTTIIVTGEDASSRIGKPYFVRLYCYGIDKWGNSAFFCYNYDNGIFRGDILLADNPKIEFIAHKCN